MGYDALRKQYDPDGNLKMVPDDAFLAYVADHDGAGASQLSAPGSSPSGTSAASVPALIGQAAKFGAREAGDFGRALVEAPVNLAKSVVNIPRGLVADPLVQAIQNRPATPQEEQRTQSGLGGLVGLMIPGPLGKLLGGGRLATATAGGAAGLADAGISSGGDPRQTAAGTVAGFGLGALLHGKMPERQPAPTPEAPNPTWSADLGPVPGQSPQVPASPKVNRPSALQGLYGSGRPPKPPTNQSFPVNVNPPPLPNNAASRIARSPAGTLVSSVTDRLRAMGQHGQALDDMIEQVVQQSQREPGKHLQPFDKAVHAVTGKKGQLSVDDRSAILGALERGVNPNTLRPEIRPIYDQMKSYFDATVPRGTAVGATVSKGGKKVPIAQAAIKDYFHHAALTVKQLKDKNIRPSLERNLLDIGTAKTPLEAQQLVDDLIVWTESKGKRGGQLAIRAYQGRNPNMTAQQLQNAIFRSKPPLRVPASGLEHGREIDSPFYNPVPETVFPSHVQNTEKALAELQHYGPEAKNLTGRIKQLPGDQQHEAEHLVRTATESHQPWDPRVEKTLSLLRQAQLATFSPLTSIKNLSQRNNNVLTSDLAEGLTRGSVPLPGSRDLAARSGALAEGAHETLAQALGGESSLSRGYLKKIGFSGAEGGNRQTGAQTGLAEAAKYAKRLLKNPADALAQSRLKREGINPAQVQGGALNADQEAQAALMRSNKAQFRTHPKDLPDWFTSNPVSRTMATFKSFDYQQTRLILDETVGRMTSGHPGDKARGMRNAAILATLYPAVGEGINTLYGIAMRRETPGHAVTRTKEFLEDTAKAMSGQMSPVDYVTKYKDRYGKDVIAGSAPGVGGTFVQALEFGRGDKGGSLLKTAMGPTISRPYEAIQLEEDVRTQKKRTGEEKPMTPAQKRQALRLAAGGIGTLAGPWLYPDKNAAGNRNKP